MKVWICQHCGNVNYREEGKPDVCIRCTWEDYNKWDGVMFEEAVNAPDWKGFGWVCPVCGNHNAGDFPTNDVCPQCGWEQDQVQEDDPDYCGGANDDSLNMCKAWWSKKQSASV